MATANLSRYYELQLSYRWTNTTAKLFFHLWKATEDSKAEDLYNAFVYCIREPLRYCTCVTSHMTSAWIFNLSESTDFHLATFNLPGYQAGRALPGHDAAVLQFPTKDRAMKPGSKRLPFVSQTYCFQGQVYSDMIGWMQNLGAALISPWYDEEVENTFDYRIVKRISYMSDKGKLCWRLPQRDEELQDYGPDSYVIKKYYGPQVTRTQV